MEKIEKTKTKKELFKELGNYNEDTHFTDIVNIDKFEGKYISLKLGN